MAIWSGELRRKIGSGRLASLAPKKTQRKPHKKEIVSPIIRQHYENFTIEFLLDKKNLARRTRVAYVQSGDADTWAGWEAEQILDFIVRHTGVRLPYTKSAVPPPSVLTKQYSQVTSKSVSPLPDETTQLNSDSLPSLAVSRSKPQIMEDIPP